MDFGLRINRLKLKSIFFIFVLLPIFGFSEDDVPKYEKYAYQIASDFTKLMKCKYKLICDGSGGSMPRNIESLMFSFIYYGKATVEEARSLEVHATEDFLELINNDLKIRPFLKTYPFTPDCISILISFYNPKNDYFGDGSIAASSQVGSKIYYKTFNPENGKLTRIGKESYQESRKLIKKDF